MRSRLLLVIIGVIVLITGCSDLTKEEILVKSQEKINNINTYQCRVEVEVYGNKGSQLYEIMQAYKEGSFRLETKNPKHLEGKVVIIKDNRAKIYHPTIEQSTIIENFTQKREECMFLGDFLTWNFQENLEVTEITEQDQDYFVLKKDIAQGNFYHNKQCLWIEKKTLLPRYIKIYDKESNIRVEISIFDLEINKSLEDGLFTID